MSWNYRVMEFIDEAGEAWQEIREVYYEGEKPNGYTTGAASVGSENIAGLNWVLDRMREALYKPVLREKDFGDANQNAAKLAPPPGFENWLDYAVAASSAARDINIQSLFDPTPWGREVSRDEVNAAIEEELKTLRHHASRNPKMK